MRSKRVLYRCRTPGWGLLYRRALYLWSAAASSCRFWTRTPFSPTCLVGTGIKNKTSVTWSIGGFEGLGLVFGGMGRRPQEHDPLFGQFSVFLMHFWKNLTEKCPILWGWHNRLGNPGSITVNIYQYTLADPPGLLRWDDEGVRYRKVKELILANFFLKKEYHKNAQILRRILDSFPLYVFDVVNRPGF